MFMFLAMAKLRKVESITKKTCFFFCRDEVSSPIYRQSYDIFMTFQNNIIINCKINIKKEALSHF